MQPVSTNDFSFIPNRKDITVYYRGEPVYQFSAVSKVAKEALEHIKQIAEACNGHGYYYATQRRIREIQEQRKFPLTYPNFQAYVTDWPEAERSRAWCTNSGRSDAVFVQVSEHWNCMPGGYYWVSLHKVGRLASEPEDPLPWYLRVHDNDDGACVRSFATQAEAEAAREELLKLAPTTMQELCELAGYQWD